MAAIIPLEFLTVEGSEQKKGGKDKDVVTKEAVGVSQPGVIVRATTKDKDGKTTETYEFMNCARSKTITLNDKPTFIRITPIK